MDDSLCLADTTELARMVQARAVSSRELLDAFVARIERLDGPVNAVCTLDLDAASARAAAADRLTASGAALRPLHGLPITIKDAIATEGIRSTGGAVVLTDHVPTADAPAVASLRDAGAVVFGKTNLPEWSGKLQTYNDLFGTTNNPWDPARTPGGSSGGAAAATAMGFTSFELGTDIGGSIRVPAAFCGVFGHKPSFGLIPTLGYIDTPEGGAVAEVDINTFGPIARSARDLDLLVGLLAGPGDERRTAWRVELPPSGVGPTLKGLRVAVWLGDDVLPCDSELAAAHAAVVDALRADGALVDEQARPELDLASAWRFGSHLLSLATYVSLDEATIEAARSGADTADAPDLARRLEFPHRLWLHAERDRARIRAAWARFFGRFDIVICPVAGRTALPHDQDGSFGTMTVAVNGVERPYVEMIGWTALIGSAYLPSTSTPVGRTPAGYPVGVQVVAPFLQDRRAIAVAGRMAELTGGYAPPPAALG